MGDRGTRRALPSGFAKVLAVIALAGGAGVAVGAGLSELSGGDSDAVESSDASTSAVTASPAGDRVSTSSSSSPPAQTASTRPSVYVLDSVLHPAGTLAGQRRERARLTVRVRVENRTNADLTPARPTVVVGTTSTATDPGADGPGTHFGTLKAGQMASATLRFEVAGAVTRQLTSERRAVIHVAGREHPISIKLGNPVDTPTGTRVPDE